MTCHLFVKNNNYKRVSVHNTSCVLCFLTLTPLVELSFPFCEETDIEAKCVVVGVDQRGSEWLVMCRRVVKVAIALPS